MNHATTAMPTTPEVIEIRSRCLRHHIHHTIQAILEYGAAFAVTLDDVIIFEVRKRDLGQHFNVTSRTVRRWTEDLCSLQLPWLKVEKKHHTLRFTANSEPDKKRTLPGQKEEASRTRSGHEADINRTAQDMQRVRAVAGDTYPDSSNKLEEEEVTRTRTHEKTHTTQPTTSTTPSSEISIQEEHTLERDLADAIQGHGFDVNHWGIKVIVKGLRSWAGEDDELAMAFVVSKLTALQDRGADKSLVVTALTRDGQGWLDRNPAWASTGTSKPARQPEAKPIWRQMGMDEKGWEAFLATGI